MNIHDQVKAGKIMLVPLNGSPVAISKIPQDFTPHYSGAYVILAGEQIGDTNLNIKQALQQIVKGNAVVLSQETWHAR